MIIEFIGSTGSGKTTLISEVQRKLAQRADVLTSFDLVASPLGLQNISHPTAQNIIQELACFPFLISSFRRYKPFLAYTYRIFSRSTKFSIHTINNLRSLERKIGSYEIAKRFARDRIILVDEGPILAAHMFAFANDFISPGEISVFASLLPLPDLIIYVRAPVDTLVKRTLHRPDPPREMSIDNPDMTESHAKRAVAIFDELMNVQNIWNRLLVVDNPDTTKQEHEKIVDNVVGLILDHKQATHETVTI